MMNDLVIIPSGSFMMGSPENEKNRYKDESPQRLLVTIKSFLMGKYPVTQAQWKVVAALPQVNRELDQDPSYFKGSDRPVEQVSWYDAVEFCARLSVSTDSEYRLPTEAEWEYACRAGTTTPFYFGETITTDLANYNGKYTYANEAKGEYRKQTTEVGNFPPNGFGLYDMHGNVWEWCLDDWHDSYEGAPTDGSAWINEEQNDNEKDSQYHVVRGGSWFNNPQDCRSACRNYNGPDHRLNIFGFRVVCSVG